jgi:hypothetical protein
VLTVPRLLRHELWRDEAWQWLVIIESRSVGDLFAGLAKGGGIGYLFPTLGYLAAQVSVSPRAYQLVHLVVASGAVLAFARWAPFARRERLLFLLGYLPFYEYAVISRSYSTGALLLWLTCAAVGRRWPALAVGAAAAWLVQTTVYSFIVGTAIVCGWLLDRWLHRRGTTPAPWRDTAVVIALVLAGAVAALVQFRPAPGTSVLPWRFWWDSTHARKTLATAWRAFVPLPEFHLNFWNTNVLDAWPEVQAVGALAVLGLAAAFLWTRAMALTVFVIGAAGLLAFGYLQLVAQMRQQGQLWLLFMAALWLAGGQAVLGDRRSWRRRVLLVLLIVHVAAAAFASWMDLRHVFSNGAATAALIRRTGLDRHPLLGHREPPAASVALFLGQPLYSPSRKIFVTHPDWGPRQRELTPREVRCAARELAEREGRDVVLVLNWPLPAWTEVEPAGSVTGAIVRSEDYHLYWLRRARLEGAARDADCPGGG